MDAMGTKSRVALVVTSLLALAAWAAMRDDDARVAKLDAASPAAAGATATHARNAFDETQVAAHFAVAAALAPADAGADPLQVEPRVPRAAGTPCVQTLMTDMPIVHLSDEEFRTVPASTCPGPWSKVTLVVELTGPRENADPSGNIQLYVPDYQSTPGAAAGVLFVGGTQITDDIALWRLERDVTEISKYFTRPQQMYFPGTFDNPYLVFDELAVQVRAAKLLFYRAAAATPAQRVADHVFPVMVNDGSGNDAFATRVFPRNIEQAFVDLYAQPLGTNQRLWSSCAPDESIAAFPLLHTAFALGDAWSIFGDPPHGCASGSWREVEVRVDDRLAGVAPVFPWLPSNLTNALRNSINWPAPGIMALNFIPYRVDLTPFAGLLNNGVEHTVTLHLAGQADNDVFVSGQLILYTDKGRSVVPGAVTGNTLAAANPTVDNGLVQTDFIFDNGAPYHYLSGTVTTRSRRDFHIDGYVDTSRGRVRSTVIQSTRFTNAVTWDITGADNVNSDYFGSFSQNIRLSSNVDRTSRRTLGTTMLSEDKLSTTYPLAIDYLHAGEYVRSSDYIAIRTDRLDATVHQARALRISQFRRGTPRYHAALTDVLDAQNLITSAFPENIVSHSSTRAYLFTDDRGGCYSAGLTTSGIELDTRTRGDACPGGVNALRWWSHPDGSPDSMGWAPAP
jgi:hypothetical protein